MIFGIIVGCFIMSLFAVFAICAADSGQHILAIMFTGPAGWFCAMVSLAVVFINTQKERI